MFIHLGGDIVVRGSEVIAIFDFSIEQSSKISKQFIQHALNTKLVEMVDNVDYKTLVITTNKVYYSPISSTTLKKRANQVMKITQ